MPDKQKVTLYLSPELHRNLKVRAAMDSEPMSSLAERALLFYLDHSEVVDEVQATIGHNHRLYHCPERTTPVVVRGGELVAIAEVSQQLEDAVADKLQLESSVDRSPEEGNLVTC